VDVGVRKTHRNGADFASFQRKGINAEKDDMKYSLGEEVMEKWLSTPWQMIIVGVNDSYA
jgi:hypothetical protein